MGPTGETGGHVLLPPVLALKVPLRSTAVSGEQWTSPRLISAHLFTASPVPLCTCRLPCLGLRAPALCLGSFCTCLLPCPGQLGEAGLSPPVTPLADACETGRVWNA